MTHRVLNKQKAKSIIQIYSDVMKTIQCAHPPHHHNDFVVTCRLWTASDHKAIVVMRKMGALDCLYDVSIYLYIYIYIYMLKL